MCVLVSKADIRVKSAVEISFVLKVVEVNHLGQYNSSGLICLEAPGL